MSDSGAGRGQIVSSTSETRVSAKEKFRDWHDTAEVTDLSSQHSEVSDYDMLSRTITRFCI